ncbi:hypothetical protein MY533_12560, partial [Lysinibacillus sp. Ag94]
GTWEDLDTQNNQTWTTVNASREYQIPNNISYNAYRIKWSANNGNTIFSGLGELDFYEEGTTTLNLKREYEYDMTMDDTWSDTGSLHRQKINRSDFVKIDKLYIFEK